MKIKKLISGISALAVAASAFAGLAVTANAATSVIVDTITYDDAGAATKFTASARCAVALADSPGGINTTKCENIAGSGGANGYGYYVPLTEDQATNKIVNFEFDLYMGARITNLSLSAGGSRAATTDGRALTFSYNANDGKVKIGDSSTFGNVTTVANASTWLHIVADVNNVTKSTALKVYNMKADGAYSSEDIAYSADVPFSDKTLSAVRGFDFFAPNTVGLYIDNIKISTTDIEVTLRDVTYSVKGVESHEIITDGSSVQNIPDTYNPGYTFKGWTINEGTELYTTEQIAEMAITADTKLTAQYEIDPTYVEAIASVSISGADSMTFGPDPNTAESNPYTVVINGADGTTITEDNLSDLVTDFNIAWDINGFKTENDTEGQYCDSYGAFAVNNEGKVATSFELRNVPMNFYGLMTAVVTYNGEKYTATKPVIALGNKTAGLKQILPEAGYPSSFNTYSDALVGYSALNDTLGSAHDSILGGWVFAGSDAARNATIGKDADTKYLRVTTSTGNSHDFSRAISASQSQSIFVQKVRFISGSTYFALANKVYSGASGYSAAVTLNYSNGALTLNGEKLKDSTDADLNITANVWYYVVLSADPTTHKAYALIYDTEGNYLGGIDNIEWASESSPAFFTIGAPGKTAGVVDIAEYEAYYPTADESTYTLTASQDTLSIPNKDTADLAAALKTADGYDITGAATWTVLEADMAEGVIITPDAADSHKAKVTLGEGAAAGEATVQVNIGGYTKTITLNITSSAESVKFTKSNTSVSIPLNDTPITAEYAAIVVNGEGTDLNREVSLAVYDKNNTSAYTLPEGITFENGVLTVTKAAPAVTFTIRATGKNTDGEDISKSVKVTVHGLSFDFGAGAEADLVEGYTAVTPDTSYTAARGYGIASGSVTAGGTASTEDATADYLEGAMTFKADVQKGKNYTVEITYQGTLKTGYINSDLAGYDLGTQGSFGTAKYTVAVPVDTLDLIVSGDGAKVASITITKDADKAPNVKPDIHHVGDSTAANRGSWAYKLSSRQSNYEDLVNAATFYNNGAGGRNLCSYYTEGKLGSVLRAIEPGDIVMFGNNGTNGMGSHFEEDVNYYLDAAEAMGAKIIINSYTPHGAVGGYANGYDSATHTFTSYRQDSYDNIVRAIAEERKASDPNYLGFVEIGKQADKIFNAYVANYENETNKEGTPYTSMDEAAARIIGCFSDHNHYYDDNKGYTDGLVGDLMLNGYDYNNEHIEGIVEQIVAILSGDTPEPPTPVTYTVTFKAEGADDVTRTVNAGEKVTDIPAVPTKEGFTGKWMIGEDEFTTETVINADTKVTAVYTAIPVSEEKIEVKSKSLTGRTLTAEISNTTKEAVNIAALVAVYDTDRKLIKVTADQKEVAADSTATFNTSNDADGNSVKAFIWNMSADLTPLADVIAPAE